MGPTSDESNEESAIEEDVKLEPVELSADTIARRVVRELPVGADLQNGRLFWHCSRHKFLHAEAYSGFVKPRLELMWACRTWRVNVNEENTATFGISE